MRIDLEISEQESCLNRARSGEYVFVLLARDAAAPVTIRAWIQERIRLGKNSPSDPQIIEAEDCARDMEAYRRRNEATA